jgi:hypothetical protein
MLRQDDVPENLRRPATLHTLEKIRYFSAAAEWMELGEALVSAGFTVEQEGVGSMYA